MREKITRDDALRRAARDFKHLVLYYNVTRPQQLPYFKRNGKFSLKELNRQIYFGSKSMDELKQMHMTPAKFTQVRAYQAHYNYTFGIPRDRICAVLKFYRDENGRKVRIHISDILQKVEEDLGKLEHIPHGEAWGKFSYFGKWMMSEETREKYIKDKKWSDIFDAPGVTQEFKDLIQKWIKEDTNRSAKKQGCVLDEEQRAKLDEYLGQLRSGVLTVEDFKERLRDEFSTVIDEVAIYIKEKTKGSEK